jgi:hypothetical protein
VECIFHVRFLFVGEFFMSSLTFNGNTYSCIPFVSSGAREVPDKSGKKLDQHEWFYTIGYTLCTDVMLNKKTEHALCDAASAFVRQLTTLVGADAEGDLTHAVIGYWYVLQYCPNPLSGDTCALGVYLDIPAFDYLRAHMIKDCVSKVGRFFGEAQANQMEKDMDDFLSVYQREAMRNARNWNDLFTVMNDLSEATFGDDIFWQGDAICFCGKGFKFSTPTPIVIERSNTVVDADAVLHRLATKVFGQDPFDCDADEPTTMTETVINTLNDLADYCRKCADQWDIEKQNLERLKEK